MSDTLSLKQNISNFREIAIKRISENSKLQEMIDDFFNSSKNFYKFEKSDDKINDINEIKTFIMLLNKNIKKKEFILNEINSYRFGRIIEIRFNNPNDEFKFYHVEYKFRNIHNKSMKKSIESFIDNFYFNQDIKQGFLSVADIEIEKYTKNCPKKKFHIHFVPLEDFHIARSVARSVPIKISPITKPRSRSRSRSRSRFSSIDLR